MWGGHQCGRSTWMRGPSALLCSRALWCLLVLHGEARQGEGHHRVGLPSLSLGMIHPSVCMQGSSVPRDLCSTQQLQLLLPSASVPPSREIAGLRKLSHTPVAESGDQTLSFIKQPIFSLQISLPSP